MLAAAACSTAARPAAARPASAAQAAVRPYLLRFHTGSQIASTVPANGDVNPYGITVVPQTTGGLVRGDVLVSNFNDRANVQGTGTTIVEISPDGTVKPFARLGALPSADQCPGGVGLTTGLEVLPGGWVVAGSLPTASGGALPAMNPAGCLIVLNNHGTPAATWVNQDINGPWDMTMRAGPGHAELFLSDVLSRAGGPDSVPPPSGLCDVVRLDVSLAPGTAPRMTGVTVVGSGFPWQQNKAALIQGPTGLALGRDGTLYVVSTIGNSITAIPGAVTRKSPAKPGSGVLTSGGALDGPLGLTLAPGGDLIAVNGNNGNAVEITPGGRQVATVTLVQHGAGDLFGVTTPADGQGLLFVNDGTNALDLLSA
ncbi:MAG: hypothetical protein ABSA03_10040 [Streptosporangiaceae bacterium]|jgi:hypothetical protein